MALPAATPAPSVPQPSHRASGKLLHVNERLGSLVLEVAAETEERPRQLQMFIIGREVLVGQQGRALELRDLRVGKFVTVEYIMIDGARHAQGVTVADVPSRV
jgi:hypothetical protein